jgi:catechol 2,3-dioxygenase-like lactoylglutathione lyase family enzyme
VSDVVPARLQSFFKVAGDQPTCKIGWLRVPGGAVLEIFEFRPDQPPTKVAWNRAGLTHLCFNIRNAKKWHDYLVTKGVEIVSIPERSPNGGQWFFFVKDCDGNLIELTQLGVTNDFLLRWLGPFGGWLAQRGMVRDYRRYYQPKRDDPP